MENNVQKQEDLKKVKTFQASASTGIKEQNTEWKRKSRMESRTHTDCLRDYAGNKITYGLK